MKIKSTFRTIAGVFAGYIVVGIFMISVIAAIHAENWFEFPSPLSEATIMIIAAIITAPLLIPFVWKRITKIKFGNLSIDLEKVSERLEANLAVELVASEISNFGLGEIPDLLNAKKTFSQSLLDWIPGKIIADAIKAAQNINLVEVDIGSGDKWFTTRLFLLAALSEDFTGIRQVIILETRQDEKRIFLGSTTPAMLRHSLASINPELDEIYESAKREPIPTLNFDVSENEVVLIAINFFNKLEEFGGEENLKRLVTTDLLEQFKYLSINKYSIQWSGNSTSTLLLYQIIDRTESYIPLVRNDGRLIRVINRMELTVQIAKSLLRQRLEGPIGN